MDNLSKLASSPWHQGEKLLQEKVGVSERMDDIGQRVIRDFMPDQHRDFYHQLPFMVVGAVDDKGYPWATLLEGKPGFVTSPDPQQLCIASRPAPSDPAAPGIGPGRALGLLGIELHSRRRNRINGHVQALDGDALIVKVEHSYGNCPQYIQLREMEAVPPSQAEQSIAEHHSQLDSAAAAFIATADTLFVASYVDHPGGGRSVDVSHRGGQSGFVGVEGNTLIIPDYSGNKFFNTLGNLAVNPKAGLVFIDFVSGDLLQISGHTELVLEGPEVKVFSGAERLWKVHVDKMVRRPAALALRWRFEAYSPYSLETGTYLDAKARLQSASQQWQDMKVMAVQDEAEQIRSFYLTPQGAALPDFAPGQHLALRLAVPGQDKAVVRTYSLSCAPADEFLRISVKREGLASSFLHDAIVAGSVLQTRAPEGNFYIDVESSRPLVLLAGGIGITPLLSMAREALARNTQRAEPRRVYLFHSARSLAQLPFRQELDDLVAGSQGVFKVVRLLSEPEPEATVGEAFDHVGRLSMDHLKAVLPFDDYDFYLCGPGPYTQGVYDGLRAMGMDDCRIHAEAFGPSSLRRHTDGKGAVLVQPPAATEAVLVMFSASKKEARWQPDSGSLLELSESRGLNPDFSCRGGSCGTCRTRLLSGQVHYPNPPAQMPPNGEVLICCAVPAKGEDNGPPLVLDL
ncbi:pyridoxamine 5'-phosphate oxidase family protein [Gallaecimonas pentaromativorans]|uniref:FAD-binding oxidoreductase n=1 Tax=Gallaecimonas pentaromativorans TaxID=584787 RepID=A0A3N1P9W3_9GAMM|nr:pyridoxamine 5'-phosphate oxidase family protein [Gallaecimonas pentaromativorans]ROQ28794.1 hypothetical protein EDC28_103389 [Gallaecimonas pentaromativorans]